METASEQVHGSEFTVAPTVAAPAEAPVGALVSPTPALLSVPATADEASANPVEASKLADAPQLITPTEIVAAPATEILHAEPALADSAIAAIAADATVTIAAPTIAVDPIPTVTVPFKPSISATEEPLIAADAPKTDARKAHARKTAPGSAPSIAPPVKYVPPQAARSASAGRFGLLAAVIALAAGIGAAGGAAGYAGITTAMAPAPAPVPVKTVAVQQRSDNGDEIKALKDTIAQMRGNLKTLSDGVAALRASSDNGGKAAQAQLAKLSEAVERLERAQAEPNARLAKLGEALDRIDRRPTTTAAASHAAPAVETTGSIKPPPLPPLGGAPNAAKQVLEGWTLLRVQGGIALVDGRYGASEVEVGDDIRGAGRVQEIRRQDGRWMVVTNRGLIVPGR